MLTIFINFFDIFIFTYYKKIMASTGSEYRGGGGGGGGGGGQIDPTLKQTTL